MMKNLMFSVYDVKSETFQRPFMAVKEGEAMRSFTDICKDKEHPLGQHPGDYTLYLVGSFNASSGKFENVENDGILTGLEAAGSSED